MPKPTIFLSHINEEAELANFFKSEIETSFLGMVDVFVSSDGNSIKLGQKWLEEVTEGLKNCLAILLFCSPYSIRRPWINFECGAGWARSIAVVPICHSGLRPVDLPIPISLLQGLEIRDSKRIEQIFQLIAEKLNSKTPSINTETFVKKIIVFEDSYVEKYEITQHLQTIKGASNELLGLFSKLQPNTTQPFLKVPEQLILSVKRALDALQTRGYLSYAYGVNGIGFSAPGENGGGNFGTLTISLKPKVIEISNAIMNP